jgi:type IV pilus assembly protein PilB
MLMLENLGFPSAIYRQFEQMIKRPHGLILITGPTGSGKTTTLYAALRVINHPGQNILTVENPVEYPIEGVSQIQVDTAGKVTFAHSLRSLLRHDPDVLMVGEIRDLETAQIALRAAITGHMVFSTLHTNTACGSITRLIDMGCEPYLLASTLTTSIAQRLVRRLCPLCKRVARISQDDRIFLRKPKEDITVYEAAGCINCQNTGYLGRIGVFEMIRMDKKLRKVIAQGCDEDKIEMEAEHLTTLYDDAIAKVLEGITSLEEVKRIIAPKEEQ